MENNSFYAYTTRKVSILTHETLIEKVEAVVKSKKKVRFVE
jgi:hypothetical protein